VKALRIAAMIVLEMLQVEQQLLETLLSRKRLAEGSQNIER
jgi:hypothetical protein